MGQSTIFQEINIDCQQITKNFSTKKLLEILDKFAKFVFIRRQKQRRIIRIKRILSPDKPPP